MVKEKGGFEMQRFRRRNFRRIDLPKPVKVGEEYNVEINEIGSKGDGIARVKNFVIFVNGGKAGEKVRIRIKEVRNRFAIGEKIEAEGEKVEEITEKAVKEAEEEIGEG